jgi:hypothetical protein
VSRLGVLAAWVLAVLLVAATFVAGHSHAQDKRPLADADITQRIQSAIAQDRDLAGQRPRRRALARRARGLGRQERPAGGEPPVAGLSIGSSRSYSPLTTA